MGLPGQDNHMLGQTYGYGFLFQTEVDRGGMGGPR